MSPPSRFRFATTDDIPALHRLIESAYRGESSREGWTTEADLLDGQRTDPEGLAEVIADEGSYLVVAERASVPVGCVVLEPRGDGSVYLGTFAVAPPEQGAGTGRAILDEAARLARDEWHADRIEMTVIRQREDLIAWYERNGYARTGATAPFPYGDERFGLPRRDDLEFVVLAKPLT